MNISTVIIFFVTYLICSINPAIIICKRTTGEDIRKLGSGNAGTANAMRVLGRILGTIVIIGDIAKVYASFGLCVLLNKLFEFDMDISLKSAIIIGAVVGHCFPAYYGFRGGKGVIVGITCGIILSPKIAILCIAVGAIIVLITRIPSIGSLCGLVLYFLVSIFTASEYLIPIIIVSIIILFKHRGSLQRIFTRQEEKLW